MIIPYKDILLWGHSLADFTDMFLLSEGDLKAKILDCCGGPDSFNAELTKQGGQVISCDSLFSLPVDQIEKRTEKVFTEMLAIVKNNEERFLWHDYQSAEGLAERRRKNIALFLEDFSRGLKEERYQACTLPNLIYDHYQFDLALCSHYLFANCPDQSIDFHVVAISSLCHVAREVRIFPLLDSEGDVSEIVGPVMQALYHRDYGVEIKAVPYEFQRKGNAMLKVWALTCEV